MDIVCFAGASAIAPHVMRVLAARGHRVLRIEPGLLPGLRERAPNLWTLTPIELPFGGTELLSAPNAALIGRQIRRALDELRFEDVVSWCFVNSPLAGALGERRVVDHTPGEDRGLLLRADAVFCATERLRDAKSRFNANVHLVPNGADLDHFALACDPATPIAPELKGLPGPIIGWWGLAKEEIDAQLVRYVADAFSGGTVVALGECETSGARNVRALGSKPYEELPRFARGFDVALLPLSDRRANPPAALELLASGLPLVSAAALDSDGVAREIAAAVAAGPGPSPQRALRMSGQSWEARVREMEAILLGEHEQEPLRAAGSGR